MKVRKLQPEEHGLTRELYENVFSEDSRGFVDYYYSEKVRDNQIYVVEEEGKIRAMLHLNPYEIMVNGIRKKAHYIVAVATEECFRGRGFMASLLREAMKEMFLEGESFTFLMPAAEAIYTPYGFRTVYKQKRRICEFREKTIIGEGEEEIQILPATDSMCEELADWANRRLEEEYQVYALRDGEYYRRLIKEYESDGGRCMLYCQNGQMKDCRFFVPDTDGEAEPKIMVRILDVRRMLLAMRVKSLMAACFLITDEVIEENNRCVVITGTEFSGLMLMDAKPENAEGRITVAALASFMFGAKSVDEICMEKGVEMTERMKGELKKIIPLSRIYLNEIV